MLNDPARRTVIESVLSRRTGHPYRVEVILRSDFGGPAAAVVTPSPPQAPQPDQASPEPDSSTVISDEDGEKFIGAVVRIFDGTIIDDQVEDR
jgi:hypothetical protein